MIRTMKEDFHLCFIDEPAGLFCGDVTSGSKSVNSAPPATNSSCNSYIQWWPLLTPAPVYPPI